MRISSDENDLGYLNYDPKTKYEIFLNGDKQDNVITADEENGYLLLYTLDLKGKYLNKGDGTAATHKLSGKVEIKVG